MLSILIPTYNYTIFPLVENLHEQALAEGIAFEVCCLDDGSAQFQVENEKINTLPHCSYKVLPKNIGRSAIRNKLGREAKFENLLFLDADTMPISGSFVKHYLAWLSTPYEVIYGGIVYQEIRPEKEQILRWVYGNEREALEVKKRSGNPYLSLLTLNFLIRKEVLLAVPFNEEIPNLRHEDTLFSFDLKKAGKEIMHIDNPVQHNGLESSTVFLRKSEEAVEGLYYLLQNQLLPYDYTKISSVYLKIGKSHLLPIMAFFFKVLKKSIRRQLLSASPSLRYFDLYRLLYLCSLSK